MKKRVVSKKSRGRAYKGENLLVNLLNRRVESQSNLQKFHSPRINSTCSDINTSKLSKTPILIKSFETLLKKQKIPAQSKKTLLLHFNKLAQQILFTISQAETPVKKTQKRNSKVLNQNLAGYKEALNEMRVQTAHLKQQVSQIQSNKWKQIVQDQKKQMALLSEENAHIKKHIQILQVSFKQQIAVTENLKSLIESMKIQQNTSHFKEPLYIEDLKPQESQAVNLQQEIRKLDSEIQSLQESLNRALLNSK